MQLNHLNLTVDNAQVAGEFLAKYFGLKPMDGVRMTDRFAILRDEVGMILTLIKDYADAEIVYPSNFHIGFAQASEEDVNAINERLKADGYEVPPPSRQHGSWTFYFTAPGGYTIEVLG